MSDVSSMIGAANQIRLGTIVSIDSQENTAVVSMQEFSASTSGSGEFATTHFSSHTVQRTCRTLNRGSKVIKDYFNYRPGEKVICVFPVRIAGGALMIESTGYIVGSFFDDNNKPPCFYEQVHLIDFGIGNILVNLEDKSLDIEFEGDISINGRGIYLNG